MRKIYNFNKGGNYSSCASFVVISSFITSH